MRYVDACLVEDLQAMTYRFYVTDVLKGIVGANVRYADIAIPERRTLNDDRSPEEIVDGIKAKLSAMSAEK